MIRYGTNPIAWTNDDEPSLGAHITLEMCLAEAAAIGFDGIEKGNRFPTDPAGLRAALAPHGLAFVSGWHSLHLLQRSVDAEWEAMAGHIALLKAEGCAVCIVSETSNSVHGKADVPLSTSPSILAPRWPYFCADVEEIAKRCADEGLSLVYHPHMGTIVETPEELDAFMAHAGENTFLLFDTGHCLFGGGDPTATAQKYMARTRHIHAKNVRPEIMDEVRREDLSFIEGVRRGVFTVPGDPEGAVDFAPVLKAAAAHGYDGWLVIEAEQDPAVRVPLEYQSLGLKTLKSLAAEAGLEREHV